MLPLSNEFKDLFQINYTFLKECAIYTVIAPVLTEFAKEFGVSCDIFCQFYAARKNFYQYSDVIDENAVIILENLVNKGYKMGNRRIGFEPNVAFFVIKTLAKFHALPMALKYWQPEYFEYGLKMYLQKLPSNTSIKEIHNSLFRATKQSVKKAILVEKLLEKVLNRLDLCEQELIQPKNEKRNETFFTIAHNDFWVNNLMIKFDENGEPENVKILDYQLIVYDSGVRDLILFIFSSINDKNLGENLDNYLRVYYDSLTECLRTLKRPLTGFSYEEFMEEVNRIAAEEFYHIIFMLRGVILANKIDIDRETLNAELFCNDDIVDEAFFERIRQIVEIYNNKMWI